MSTHVESQDQKAQQASSQMSLADVDDQLRSLQPASVDAQSIATAQQAYLQQQQHQQDHHQQQEQQQQEQQHQQHQQQQQQPTAGEVTDQYQLTMPQQQYYNSQQYYQYIPQDQHPNVPQQQLAPASPQDPKGIKKKGSSRSDSITDSIKKCSRCRVKRMAEDPEMLIKYQTCLSCRMKRKVKQKKVRTPSKLPNLSDNWDQYQEKVSMNTTIDLFQHNYRNYTDPNIFPRYQKEELNEDIIKHMSQLVVSHYITPLQILTGFKLAIRDHHKPKLQEPEPFPNKSKKITWMYICSQDRYRQRKSRSENKRQVVNKLKTEECDSKITLNYDLVTGIVQLSYNHKHHPPFNWKKDEPQDDIPFQLQDQNDDGESRRYHHNLPSNKDTDELSTLLKQDTMDTNEIVELATRAAESHSNHLRQQNQHNQSGNQEQVNADQLYEMQLLQQQQQLAQQVYQHAYTQQQNYAPQNFQRDGNQDSTTSVDNVDDELKKDYYQQSHNSEVGATDEDVIDHELIRESESRR
ncbi:hypothetical protein CANARDRAFT_20416 [[Candida] arabinofermentans NRRL YB-2248]|uniref:Uncharacterized protein n=1 Tax=[Candida] arabinofermentans NRRL YB-2248 TaxID=983967 RepID=A0A1E4T7E1_9ASCO|nr:hypothetical protein CANARDRAFT_20416 [[Candida] arabinofermentans NRRL YB-2248]